MERVSAGAPWSIGIANWRTMLSYAIIVILAQILFLLGIDHPPCLSAYLMHWAAALGTVRAPLTVGMAPAVLACLPRSCALRLLGVMSLGWGVLGFVDSTP